MTTTTQSTQTFELSEDDAKLAVAEFIEKRYGIAGPVKVELRVATVSTGMGINEHDTRVIKVSASRALP